MLKPERMALELLEYKLDDARARRAPKGGADGWALHDFVMRRLATLSPEEKARLASAGQALLRLSERPGGAEHVKTFDQVTLSTVEGAVLPTQSDDTTPQLLSQEELEEQACLRRLAKRVWSFDLDRVVERLTTAYKAERERHTARVLYGLMRNFARYSREVTFYEDVHLIHFKVTESIPELSDPLASLTEARNISTLIYEIIEVIMTLKSRNSPYARLQIREEEALDYLRRMALAVARDPYAGRMTAVAPKGPTSRQLRMAIEELEREPLREDEREQQRRRLQERLRSARAYERTQRELFEKDVQMFRQAVDGFFDQLSSCLPRRVGGLASEPQLPGGVLFAVNPGLRLESTPKGAMTLTVNVKGPVRLAFGGEELALTRSGEAIGLYVGGQEHTLDLRLDVRTRRKRLLAFREGCYVHLRLMDDSRSLAALTAEALLVIKVLGSPHRDDLVTLLRTATGVARGDPQEVVRRALARMVELVATAPEQRLAVKGFVQAAQRAVGLSLPETVLGELADGIGRFVALDEGDLEGLLEELGDAKQGPFNLGNDPKSLTVAGEPLTVRRYPPRKGELADSVVLMAPGKVVASFYNSLIHPFESGTLVCTRCDSELLVLFFEGVKVSPTAR